MVNQMFIGCDSDKNDYLTLESEEGNPLFVGISDAGKVSFIAIKSRAKIQELIDCLEKAKEDLYQ